MNPNRTAADETDVVLIVDDVPDNLAVLHDALDESGYTVLVATSGEAALATVAQARPDIVLLDAVMPGLDGFEVARRLKADAATAGIPIIFMTGLTDTEHVVDAFGAGVVDYVTKPVRTRELIARIESHLRTARAQGQARRALDAFGHATFVVRERDGRRLWQTALARELLRQHFPTVPEVLTPPPVMAWVAREALRRRAGAEPQGFRVGQGSRRLTFAMHAIDDSGDGEWLVVLREDSEAALLDALARAFPALTAREVEVLYWVVQGKTNRDIGDILSLSPRTVHKHLEHVFGKLGVETRTAAASLAMARVGAPAR
ncbi:response regulator transcription factor [Azohydromonas sediminis]|uniref:response regulator transcription factor n=1 Tax=Azohydromonas sediminis TaxID=2259674 RepID=UPI000E64C01E|nr:response regulator transcription factor [Azohydromonas sediminis]